MLHKDNAPNIELGVQVSGPFTPAGRVIASTLPGGLTATATHTGPVSEIGDTHLTVREWNKANGFRLTGTHWEVYGDPNLSTGDLEIDVFCSLAAP